MKRAASPQLLEVVSADSVDPTESEVITEIVTEISGQELKRQRTEEEVCVDDGYAYTCAALIPDYL